MYINELARFCHVNPETIRMYRSRGLISARRNPANGYYEYDEGSLLQLLHLRKMRGEGLSLDMIRSSQGPSDLSELIAGYEHELDGLARQMEQLRSRQFMLQMTLDHLRQLRESPDTTALIDAYDTRYDLAFRYAGQLPALEQWIAQIDLFTLSFNLPLAVLRAPLPERLRVEPSLGTYLHLLQEHQLPVPPEAVCFPRGQYAAAAVELDGPDHIRREQLQPLLDSIAAHGLRPVSDSTAFLVRIDRTGARNRFFYRMRVRVEPAE